MACLEFHCINAAATRVAQISDAVATMEYPSDPVGWGLTVDSEVGRPTLVGGAAVVSPVGVDDGDTEGPLDPEGAIVGAVGELEGEMVDGEIDGDAEGMLVVSARHVAFVS